MVVGTYFASFTRNYAVVDARGFVATDLTWNNFNLGCKWPKGKKRLFGEEEKEEEEEGEREKK